MRWEKEKKLYFNAFASKPNIFQGNTIFFREQAKSLKYEMEKNIIQCCCILLRNMHSFAKTQNWGLTKYEVRGKAIFQWFCNRKQISRVNAFLFWEREKMQKHKNMRWRKIVIHCFCVLPRIFATESKIWGDFFLFQCCCVLSNRHSIFSREDNIFPEKAKGLIYNFPSNLFFFYHHVPLKGSVPWYYKFWDKRLNFA